MLEYSFLMLGTSALSIACLSKLPDLRVHHLYLYAGVAMSVLLVTILWLIFSFQSH
jgi:hypothetical protein